MIRSPLRAGLALACALSLSACGGGDGDVYVGGTVVGNSQAGLVLTNNDGPRLEVPAGQNTFVFPDLVETDAGYNVKVVASPANTTGCTVVEGTGTGKAVFSVTTVQIVCTLKTYPLTARVTGRHLAGLKLVNGADSREVPAGDGPVDVNMAPIPADAPYGVAVLAAPGQTCTVANGSNKMTTAGATVDVTCTTP